MDGTRKYALFTPDQTNSGQKNRYIPEVGKGNIIQANAEKANEVVDSIGNDAQVKANIAAANARKEREQALNVQKEALDQYLLEEDELDEPPGFDLLPGQSLASQDNLGQGTPINFN